MLSRSCPAHRRGSHPCRRAPVPACGALAIAPRRFTAVRRLRHGDSPHHLQRTARTPVPHIRHDCVTGRSGGGWRAPATVTSASHADVLVEATGDWSRAFFLSCCSVASSRPDQAAAAAPSEPSPPQPSVGTRTTPRRIQAGPDEPSADSGPFKGGAGGRPASTVFARFSYLSQRRRVF